MQFFVPAKGQGEGENEMQFARGGGLRRIGLMLSAGVVAALAVAGATSAQANISASDNPEFVTFCHVAGRADDPANMVTLTLPSNAVFGQAGHLNEDGTAQAGHEQDHLGACETPPPPTDVCPNIEGDQAEIPTGLVKDEQGNCVTPPPGDTGVKQLVVTKTAGTFWRKVYNWDVEKSVDKSQLNVKPGETASVVWRVDVTLTGWTPRDMIVGGTIMVANPNDTAVSGVVLTDQIPDVTVFCGVNDNADLTVPANGSVSCIYAAPLSSTQGGTNTATAVGSLNGVDVSATATAEFTFRETPNYEINKTVKAVDGKNTWSDITGTTSFTYDEEFPCSSQGRTNVVELRGDNPSTEATETDHQLDTDSASVTVQCSTSTPPPPPPPPPPTVTSDELMDVQVVKDATAQAQLVNGQADITYTVRVRNNGPNQAHNVQLADSAPAGVTFLAITTPPAGWDLHALGCAAELLARDARPRGRADDRVLGPRHADRHLRQLGNWDGSGQGHERHEQHRRCLDARHGSRDAADDHPEANNKAETHGQAEARGLPDPQGDTGHGQGKWQAADRPRDGDPVKEPGCRRRRTLRRQGLRQDRQDQQAGRRPARDYAEQGRDHARHDHERESVQQRPDRRDRRIRAAGHRLGDSPSGTRSVLPVCREHRYLGDWLVGAARPPQPSSSGRCGRSASHRLVLQLRPPAA